MTAGAELSTARPALGPGTLAVVPAPRREPHPAGPVGDDPLDVRLHAPSPDAVVVRVAGPLLPHPAALLAVRVRQQLCRAPHVVLDLTSVTWLDRRFGAEVRALDEAAAGCGARLHVAAEDDRVVAWLRRACPGRRVVPGPAEAVLATLGAGRT